MVDEGKADEHGYVVQPEFAHHVLSVGLHSAWGDVEIGGDFLGGEAVHHELQDLVFLGSQELDEGIAGFGEDKFGLRAGADVPEGENRAGHGSNIIPEWGGSNRPYRK